MEPSIMRADAIAAEFTNEGTRIGTGRVVTLRRVEDDSFVGGSSMMETC